MSKAGLLLMLAFLAGGVAIIMASNIMTTGDPLAPPPPDATLATDCERGPGAWTLILKHEHGESFPRDLSHVIVNGTEHNLRGPAILRPGQAWRLEPATTQRHNLVVLTWEPTGDTIMMNRTRCSYG